MSSDDKKTLQKSGENKPAEKDKVKFAEEVIREYQYNEYEIDEEEWERLVKIHGSEEEVMKTIKAVLRGVKRGGKIISEMRKRDKKKLEEE